MLITMLQFTSFTRLHMLPLVQHQVVLLREALTTLFTPERFQLASPIRISKQMLIETVFLGETPIALGADMVLLVESSQWCLRSSCLF